jgi:phenylacetate-CoA ligase
MPGRSDTDTIRLLKGLRVCMVAPYLPRKGGVTIQTHLEVDGLTGEGVEVVRVDTILHKINTPVLAPLRMILQLFVTAARFLKHAPTCDVVHIQACSWWGFLPVLACVPLNRLFVRKRLVISFHGAKGHIWIRSYHWMAVPFLKTADAVLVVSPLLKEAFSRYGIESEVLWNLVDLKRFHFRERPRIEPNIVWIRHMSDMYDPLTALKVFELVKKDVPEATITFIGDGPLRSVLDSYIRSHAVRDVRFTGHMDNERVPDEFDKADIFLNTSRNDGLPTALLEASASGLPIVTTGVGGIPDMMENGAEGIIVPLDDIDALHREVVGLIRDPDRAREIGASARRNAEKYSWERCAVDLVKAYGLKERGNDADRIRGERG